MVHSHREYEKLVNVPIEAPTLPGDGDSESLHLAAPIRVILPGRGFSGRLSPLLQSVLRMNGRLILNSQFAVPTEQGGVTVHDGTYDSVKDGGLSEGVLNRLAWGDGWAEYDPRLAILPS